jgi:hypothetical protein
MLYPPRSAVQAVFSAISGIAKWNLPEFLYHTFRYQVENGKPVHRTTEHAAIVSRFLQAGQSTHQLRYAILSYYVQPH